MTDHDGNEKSDDILAAEFVLGVLSRDERDRFAERMEEEPGLKERVRFWTENLAPMAEETAPVTPPAAAFQGIEDRLFPTRQSGAGWWSSLPFWRGLAVASMAALVVAAVYFVSLPSLRDQGGQSYVARISGETNTVQMVAFINEDRGRLTVSRTVGVPAQGRDFELWLIEGGNDPVSLGVLPADSVATLAVPDTFKSRLSGAVLAVSDEPLGGSPTGQPTGSVLATGNIVEI